DYIERSTVVYCPKSSRSEHSYARKLVEQVNLAGTVNVEVYELSMQGSDEVLRSEYEDTVDEIEKRVQSGGDVVAVTLGDPNLYSTAGQLTAHVKSRIGSSNVHMVPGINAYQAAASLVKRQLAKKNEHLIVWPLGRQFDETLSDVIEIVDSMVFLKVNHQFDRVYELLEDEERLKNSFLAEKIGSDDQRIRVLDDVGPN
ncbi:MAG: precorrin-2 C(20)-methyltransferase, partial [bacterium]